MDAATQPPADNTLSRGAAANVRPPLGVAARVTAQIVAALQNGVRPWVQPWSQAAALALPLRANGTPYKGVNIVTLWATAAARGYTARHWLTFKQAQALGGAVRKGERATRIVYFEPGRTRSPQTDETAATQKSTRAVLKTFAVFAVDQIEHLPEIYFCPPAPPPDPDEARLNVLFARVPARIEHGGARACYNPARDIIAMPPRTAFVSTAQYFSTLLHELGHWTGHPSRLDRRLTPRSSMTTYAAEELVAELSSAFMGAELGLPVDHIECHAAYIDSWLKALDREPGALFAAAGKAQAAADYLRQFLQPPT
jgi:antirestriction protein ArdC